MNRVPKRSSLDFGIDAGAAYINALKYEMIDDVFVTDRLKTFLEVIIIRQIV